MKTILALLLATANLVNAQIDEPIPFTAHLAGDPFASGEGMFSLTGNRFSYWVRNYPGFLQAAIHGPALPGADGPVIFDLPLTACVPPAPDGIPTGFCEFSGRLPGSGAFTLSEQQAADLLAGLWYVRSGPPEVPSVWIRGQILQVPEPSVISIVLVAGAGAVGLKHALTRAGQRRTVEGSSQESRDRQPFENVEIIFIP